jgi:hypothetical protein
MTTRRFKLTTHLTFPLELYAAPGAAYHLAEPGDVIELCAERCLGFDRFLRGRIRAGDLVELEDQPVTSPAATIAGAPVAAPPAAAPPVSTPIPRPAQPASAAAMPAKE